MPDSVVSDTVVTFSAGSVAEDAQVLRVERTSAGVVVVLDRTPFHPVDHTWPDQPGDRGALRAGAADFAVVEAVMAAAGLDESGRDVFAVGAEIPVKRGADGWTWLVGHILADSGDAPSVGDVVRAEADAAHRAALSRGHTACHLASLALDRALGDLWRKDPGTDALGEPDFEGRANQTSRIGPDGADDTYRLGKSLRKAGFDTETFAATLAEREARINVQLAEWVASAAPSRIETDGPAITDRRRWVCELPEGTASILCGGTHVSSLGSFASITVGLDLVDPQTLVMTTAAAAAP